MAQAKRSLSPKRALERLREHRRAVIALAHQRAKRLVQAGIRAKGQRLSDFSAREITLLAEDYLAQHRAELIAEAENTIATWPGFARWRLPPEVFEKIQNYEHSLNGKRVSSREIDHERRNANYSKPNTAPIGQRSLQTTRVLNGERGRTVD